MGLLDEVLQVVGDQLPAGGILDALSGFLKKS